MRLLLLFVFSGFAWITGFSQKDTVKVPRKNFVYTGGLVSYYFWEEDSSGNILPETYKRPYLQNYYIVRNPRMEPPKKAVTQDELTKMVSKFADDLDPHYHSVYSLEDAQRQKKSFPLTRYSANHAGSVIFFKTGNDWISMNRGSVHYFNFRPDGTFSYSHSSDSVILSKPQLRVPSNGQYTVYTYWNTDGSLSYQRVVSYTGEDVSEQFKNPATTQAMRLLIFANGYRGPSKEKDESDNLVWMKDRYNYWFKLDNRFAERLRPNGVFYIDGSLSMATSNHHNKLCFGWSFLRSRLTPLKRKSARVYNRLNTDPNPEGFAIRKEKGRIAGLAFLYAKCNAPECAGVKDTVDIVCHSMGYAYTLGFLASVQDKVILGKIYIIAPENAAMEGYDWSQFQEVWQYGSNLDQKNPDPLRYQDGVAPQCAVKDLDAVPATRGGRVFIPEDWPNKHFIHSHMVYSYDWIFDRIGAGMPGYIDRTFK